MSERDNTMSSTAGTHDELLATPEQHKAALQADTQTVTDDARDPDTQVDSDDVGMNADIHTSRDPATSPLAEELFSQSKHDAANDTTIELLVPSGEPTQLFRRRWVMIFLFASYSMSNAYQWIHLNIIFDKVMLYYNESLPGSTYMQQVAVDWLSMVYMLAYIPLIVPATWLLDRRGLRVVAIIATFLNAVGAWLKCAAVRPDLFAVLMTAQTICAVAQVFILGIPARLAAVWCGPNEVSTATAIGVFGNQIGCALGFVIPPEIVTNTEDITVIGSQLRVMLYTGAAVMTVLFILVIILFKDSPSVCPSQAAVVSSRLMIQRNYCRSLRTLLHNCPFVLLLVTYGLNTGSYYAIGTLLNPIVLYYFAGEAENAGRIGLTLVVAGVGGSIVSGIWLDRTKYYKLTTVLIYILSCVGMLAFTLTLRLHQMWLVFVFSALLGFFMTGYLPVGFEFAAELTFPESEGTSSGLLNASAQLFGIALTLSVRALTVLSHGILAGNLTVTGVLLLGVIGTVLIRSDLKRQKAQQEVCLCLASEKVVLAEPTSSSAAAAAAVVPVSECNDVKSTSIT